MQYGSLPPYIYTYLYSTVFALRPAYGSLPPFNKVYIHIHLNTHNIGTFNFIRLMYKAHHFIYGMILSISTCLLPCILMRYPHNCFDQAYHPYIYIYIYVPNQVTYTNHIHVNHNEFYSVTCMSMPLYTIFQKCEPHMQIGKMLY